MQKWLRHTWSLWQHGRCSQIFHEVKVTFYNWKWKRCYKRNENLKLHKSKDWLKLVTYWVKTVTITHTRTNSSAVTHLLSMLGWDMTGAHHSGNQPQLQGWSSALSQCSVHRVVPPTKGSQGDGEPLSPACCCSLNWALDSNVYLCIILWNV